MIIKEMTQAEIGRESLQEGTLLNKLAEERPHLAKAVLDGHTAFTAGDVTVVRKGSRALADVRAPRVGIITRGMTAATSVDGEPVQREDESLAAFKEREGEWIRQQFRSAPSPVPAATPVPPVTLAPVVSPAPVQPSLAKLKARLDGDDEPPADDSEATTKLTLSDLKTAGSGIDHAAHANAARADQRARSVGHIGLGTKPKALAALLGDGPKGAA